jgi:hypothetical protein
MNITEREENGIAVFVLEGRVDSEGAVDLDLALQTAVSEGKYKIILEQTKRRGSALGRPESQSGAGIPNHRV